MMMTFRLMTTTTEVTATTRRTSRTRMMTLVYQGGPYSQKSSRLNFHNSSGC